MEEGRGDRGDRVLEGGATPRREMEDGYNPSSWPVGGAEGVDSDRVSAEPMSSGAVDPHRKKGQGIERPFTARLAARQCSHQELGHKQGGRP